jgi:hypothetical protein
MKISLFELDLIQNTGLALEAIWQSINAAHIDNNCSGIQFPLVFLILPMVFHQATVEVLAGKQHQATLIRALAENPTITLELQKRMEALADRTLQSLSLGFACGILSMTDSIIVPLKKTLKVKHDTEDVKKILDASKRVGWIFAELPPEQLIFKLKVCF